MTFRFLILKRFDLKLFAILISIGAIFINRLKLDMNCANYILNKIPLSINFVNYTRYDPIIFVGGHVKSGNSVMRDILHSHPLVYCNKPIKKLSFLLQSSINWVRGSIEKTRLDHANMKTPIIDAALSSFMLQLIIQKNETAAKTFCLQDHEFILNINDVSRIFPNSKFIIMIRDPRAVAYSKLLENEFSTINHLNVKQVLANWDRFLQSTYKRCLSLGSSRCILIFYEKLVQEPEKELKRVFKQLNIPWHSSVLRDNKINDHSLYKWIGKIPESILKNISEIVPMMRTLGYDFRSKIPNYNKL